MSQNKLKWYLQSASDDLITYTQDLPFRDYFFCTTEQAEIIRSHYPKGNLHFFKMDETHVFERYHLKDEVVWKVECPRPFMKMNSNRLV